MLIFSCFLRLTLIYVSADRDSPKQVFSEREYTGEEFLLDGRLQRDFGWSDRCVFVYDVLVLDGS